MRRYRLGMMATLAVLSLAALPAAAPQCMPVPLPQLMLWAWDRGDDLRFIDQHHTGVAFLATTIRVEGGEVRVQRRRHPLRVPKDTRLLAVAHFSVEQPSPVALTHAVQAVLDIADLPQVAGIQVDFEATPSQRRFYRDLVIQIRQGMRQEQVLSATALASWCLRDRWLDALPLDEVVPMAFSMGAEENEVRRQLAAESDAMPAYCRTSLGVSMQEAFPPLSGWRRVYAFNTRAWLDVDYQKLLASHRDM